MLSLVKAVVVELIKLYTKTREREASHNDQSLACAQTLG